VEAGGGQRTRRIPRPLSCPHQRHDGARVQRVDVDALLPPFGRPVVLATIGGLARQPLQGADGLCLSTLPLLLGPPLEVRGVGEAEAVEERAAVERGGALELAASQRALELDDVGAHHVAVQPDVAGRHDERVRAERAPEPVELLGEVVARVVRGFVRPEVEQQLLPAHPPLARAEAGQQRQAALLRGRTVDRLAILALQNHPAKGPKPEFHVR
jgi:hypothetical protein